MCNDLSYKSYVIAHLTNLKYLDYILIDPDEASRAKDEHREDLQARENSNTGADDIEKENATQLWQAQLADAFLSRTNDALEQVMSEYEDEEKKIQVLPEQAEHFESFSEKFKTGISQFQTTIIGKNEARLQMIAKFKQSVKKAEEDNEKEDIRYISEYEKLEKNALRLFEQGDQDEAAEEALKSIFPKIDELENILIDKELQLVERINDAIDRFEKSLKGKVDEIKDESKSFQEEMNKVVESYFSEIEKIKDEEIKAFYAENANEEKFSPEQKEVYQDRDGLNNAISTLSDEYKNMVFGIEEEINKAYDEDLETFTNDFKNEKNERNRKHISEIMELVQEKRKKIEVTLENP